MITMLQVVQVVACALAAMLYIVTVLCLTLATAVATMHPSTTAKQDQDGGGVTVTTLLQRHVQAVGRVIIEGVSSIHYATTTTTAGVVVLTEAMEAEAMFQAVEIVLHNQNVRHPSLIRLVTAERKALAVASVIRTMQREQQQLQRHQEAHQVLLQLEVQQHLHMWYPLMKTSLAGG